MKPVTFPNIDAFANAATPTEEQIDKADEGFADLLKNETPLETLEEITKDGITGVLKWRIKELEKKFTAQAMAAMHLTPEQIAKMPVNMRVAIENKIMDMVKEQVKLAIQEEMKKKQGLTVTKMDKDTMQGIYSALQDVMA